MWQRQTLSIHYTEFPKRVCDHFDLDDDSVDYFEHDVRTQTFLQRDNRGYHMFERTTATLTLLRRALARA